MTDAALEAWYESREDDFIRRAIEMIRVYQFKMPDGVGPYYRYDAPWPTDWWAEFWRMLEREAVLEQREVFLRLWEERNVVGGRQTRLDELFRVDHERHRYIRAGQTEIGVFGAGGSS